MYARIAPSEGVIWDEHQHKKKAPYYCSISIFSVQIRCRFNAHFSCNETMSYKKQRTSIQVNSNYGLEGKTLLHFYGKYILSPFSGYKSVIN